MAPIVASPVPAVGAALVFGWLIARQIATVRQFHTTVDATTVSVEPATTELRAGGELPVTLSVTRPPAAADTALTISLPIPVAARPVDDADRQVTLAIGDTQATTTVLLSMPTAGRIRFSEPTWELVDAHARFTESFTRGPTPTVTVAAHSLQNLHVGRGGTELSAFGQHATDGTGDGITPAELRQYLSGDPADRIDWKATARLGEPYVREFEAESDREITLIVDHRADAGADQDSRSAQDSQLDYLREVALGIVESATSTSDPLGLITVGDEGLTHTITPTRQQIGYTRISKQLLELEPTPAGPPTAGGDLQHPATARRLSEQLAGDESPFATMLRPFTETAPAYVERIETDPLYGAVDYLRTTTTATQLTIILTTDTNRPQLRETVRAAASNDNAVMVFLTPQVLFDAGELADLEAAYRQYRAFEEFRTELERFGSVVAYEVGPGDRLATLLSSTHARTASRRPGGAT
jgi:uncharacterized protein (DUF58 family)